MIQIIEQQQSLLLVMRLLPHPHPEDKFPIRSTSKFSLHLIICVKVESVTVCSKKINLSAYNEIFHKRMCLTSTNGLYTIIQVAAVYNQKECRLQEDILWKTEK